MEMQTFYRIARARHCMDLSGKGAELYGGRWNPVGTPAVYAAASVSLAMLETLVHSSMLPKGYFIMKLEVPFTDIKSISSDRLPAGWDDWADQAVAQSFGVDHLFKKRSFGLLIPSVVVPEESNLVLNPGHASIRSVVVSTLRSLCFDPRLKE